MSLQHRSPLPRPAEARRERALATFVGTAYPVPDPLASEAAAASFTHRDLRGLSLTELRTEEFRVRLALALHPAPPAWFAERERMVALELLARMTGQDEGPRS